METEPNFWYKLTMENVHRMMYEGYVPTIEELIIIAQLEQLYRIANFLEKGENDELEK